MNSIDSSRLKGGDIMLESCRNCNRGCSILEKANYQIAENPTFLSLAPSLSKVIEESKFSQFKEDLLKLIASSCKNYVRGG